MNKETFGRIYCWQYINCLRLWGRLITNPISDTKGLQPLIYPLVQIILGVLELCPAGGMRLTPLRFHCAEMLQMIEGKSLS